MASVAKSKPKGTYGETSEIIQFLKDGERAIRISREKDVILVLGVTGSGKSTLSQFITGNDEHLEAVEQGVDTGEFIIWDKGNKVCSATTESCTTVPDLIIDRKTQMPVYDCPGFVDTRHVKHDLSVMYFIKKVIDSAESVKLIFSVSYPSVRRGVDRQNFMLLVKNAVTMIKDIDKFKGSIALIVTKVDNQYTVRKGKPLPVSDQNIIKNIASFLEEVKNNLIAKISQNSLPHSEYANLGNGVKFIDALLTKNGEDYQRIGLFRRPDDAGKLVTPIMLDNRKSLEKIVHQTLNFTQCVTDDFGYTVSAESINRMHKMVEQVNEKIGSDVETIAKEIEEGFLLLERDVGDVKHLYKKFYYGFEAMQNIANTDKSADPRDLLTNMREAASVLNVDMSRKSVDSILHYDRFLKFIHTLSGISTGKPLEWVEGLTNVVQSFDDSQKWYYFLINLQTTLLKYDVQNNLSKNSTVIDNLRDQIQVFGGDASPVKENLKQLLAQVYKGDSEKEYNSIKNAKLNSWKLKFLKDMLDFQVLTLCQDNKLVVVGNYVHLSDVARKRCDDGKFVEIFALSKVFIDADFIKTGLKTQVSILAPTWDVIGSPKFVLDGEPGWDHIEPKARDGAWSGADGHDGLPGLPGGAAGNFLGFGWNCVNCQFLTVSANGGRGGKGQDGGDGVDGKSGERPPRANNKENLFNIGLLRVSHENKDNQGQEGGNGGRGGEGGEGGKKGKVSIVMFDTPEANIPKTSEVDGSSGIPGEGGKGGSGGQSEHIVESNTYIFGMKAWSNGLVSHFFYPSSGGNTRNEHNDEGMKYPEPSVDVVNPSQAVNRYKAYLREHLDSSFSRLSLEEFLEQLETSEEVRDLYDTLGLVNDLQCLENQYSKLHHQVPLLPFYKSLLNRIEAYARNRPFYEITGQRKKVLAFLCMSTLSKICTIDNNLNNDLVINVKDFLGTVVRDVDQLLKDFMVAKQRNDQRAVFQKRIISKINEAYNFIKEDITLESQNIVAELDEQIQALVSETQHLQNITRKELKKLDEHMLSRAISTVLRVASTALDFFGGIGLATEGVIEGATLISEKLTLDDARSSSGILGTLPKIVDDFLTSMSEHVKEKIKLFVTQLFDVDEIFRDFEGGETSALNETRSVLSAAREDFSESFELSENPEEDLEKVFNKRSELVDFLQNQKKSVEEVLQGDPNLEKALDVLDHSVHIFTLPEGVYNVLKERKIENSRSGELDINEELKQLEAYECKIYGIIIPLCKKLKEQFNEFGAFDGKSHAALDVEKWKVQNALTDINAQILSMTEGFQVQGAMAATIEKLKFGISTMIQVYDRIQDYHDQATLADYMAELASSKAKAIQVTDRKLSAAIDDLQVIMKTNLILADYKKAMSAFGQHVFPFAKAYMEEYDLPTSLKAQNSTDDLLSQAIYIINSIERKLIKNELTINKGLDDHFFPEVLFTSRSQHGPFYVWKYETASQDISKLLQGKEIILHADITKGLNYNAVKFNEIGIRFKLANEASQIDFDEQMENFSIEMNHFGMSYYRCGNKFYVMTHDTQKIAHSVNGNDGFFSNYNSVYEKITKNEPLLSPYTMWKVKLHNVSASFDVLANFTNEIIDLALEGNGMFVTRDIDRNVCSDHLHRFYKVEETISDVSSIDYRNDQDPTGEGAEVISNRRRRSIENEGDGFGQKSGGFGVLSYLKKFVQWFTGGDENMYNEGNSPGDIPYQLSENQFEGFSPSERESVLEHAFDEPVIDHPFEYIDELGADSSQCPSNQVNCDLVNPQGSLLLLDLLMRSKTGAKRSFVAKNVDVTDDKYAHNIAYRAYVPENDEEVIIVTSADSSKKDNSSQTDLKMSTPESEQDFENQIRRLIEEQSNLTGELARQQQQASEKPRDRYVSASVSPVARIVDIATYQQHLLGISHAIHDIDEELEVGGVAIEAADRHEDEGDLQNVDFEEEERRIAQEVERQEEEVRRLLAEEKAAEVAEGSEWSDEEAASEPLLGCDRESTGYTTDDPALDNISMVHETGLTDAEGALSDVNSVYEGNDRDDGDNTSLSSRASSRLLDSDAVLSLDSLSALYDSEYDGNYQDDYRYYNRRSEVTPGELTNLADIRSMSESITRNFGRPRSETDSDL